MKTKLVDREKYIDGKFFSLYGFDWSRMEAIYRGFTNGEIVYIREPIEIIDET